MTEAIEQAERQHAAWIMRGEAACAGHAVRVEANLEKQGAVKPGNWVAALGADDAAWAAGRILRVRSDEAGRIVYFDLCLKVDPAVSLGTLGMTAPSSPVTRLPWDDFLNLLSALGADSPDSVPPISDTAYVRDLLELSVRDDLLGPAEGPHELIKDTSVRNRYLVGKLAPQPRDGKRTARVEPAAAVEASELQDERTTPRHEPGAEFAGAAGRVAPEDDALDETDTTNNQSLAPSSMGLTFCVAHDVETLKVKARWGRYVSVPGDEHEFTKRWKDRETGQDREEKAEVWRRIPRGGTVEVHLDEGSIQPFNPDDDDPEVTVRGAVRTNKTGERFVTLFLVNGTEEPGVSKDRAWVFQPEIAVEPPEGHGHKPVFRDRPSGDALGGDPEREHLALIYRNRLEFAVGHGTSVHADTAPDDPTRALRVRTEIIPRYEVAVIETAGLDPNDRPAMRRMSEEGWLDMERLSKMEPDSLREALSCLVDDYAAWIAEQKARLDTEIVDREGHGRKVVKRCEDVLRRLREGMGVLFEDPTALEAFRFANHAMAMQRIRSVYALKRRRGEETDLQVLEAPAFRSWHPFQLAFLLLSIPSLTDPAHPDRTSPVEAVADLLWFPTGGGKTEAYLGVAAFAMAMRRLKSDLGGLDASRGLAVIMRYTLRLLTLQQFQRAATLICAMEVIRRDDEEKWGREPFTLGLWVGNTVTPGKTEQSHQAVEDIRNKNRHKAGIASPAQLTSCPWCGSEIFGGRDIKVDMIVGRTLIHCGDKLGNCEFSQAKSSGQPHPGLPVKVVDEEIYRRPPTMMIATVDKFAMMAWRPAVRNLFGRVEQECERHGLQWPTPHQSRLSDDCGSGHRATGAYPAASVKPVCAIRPPDLIIQDEFHLISGPLGTMVGLYETAVDELSCWTLDGAKVRPKVVASTATVRRAEEQARSVFMRNISVFPPSGLDVEDNFFSVQRPISERPGRRYMGICSPGSSRPTVLIRTYTAFLTGAQALFERFGPVADPYMTLVGYFNSLRELGGMRRMAEDDVHTRSWRVDQSLVERPGLSQRRVEGICELTSRISSQDIPRYLDQLEVPFEGILDPTLGKWTGGKPGEIRPIDVVLATNMLSVGVDVNRLGAMVVNGQPKGTAEYIQATSRVGRSNPGLVATVLTWARPRDLSHYETFEHYHATFYQHVEAQSVTPFSPRAIDRGLTGAMLSVMRHNYDPFAANDGAAAMDSPSRSEMLETIDAISQRTWEVTDDPGKKTLTEANLKARADDWADQAGVPGRTLVYREREAGPMESPLLVEPGARPWDRWTVPMSMREVEPGVTLIMDDDRTIREPNWQPRVAHSEEGRE